MRSLIEKYTMYKKRYMKNLQFDPQLENLSKFSFLPTNTFHTADKVLYNVEVKSSI